MYPQSSDLYSDITAVTKASKCDYTQVQLNLCQLEVLCKASWDQLRLLEKDGKKRKGGGRKDGCVEEASSLHQQLHQFLKDCEERLKVLRAVYRRVINRFHSFLLFLGYSRSMVRETSAEAFCKTVSDFALEYRATRSAILQQREKEKEKEKGRKKDSQSTPEFKIKLQQSPSDENQEQVKLEEVLKTPDSSSSSSFHFDFTLPRQRSKSSDKKGFHSSRRLKW
nr:FH1/FH2 domain-containing protein 3-like [Danio rerio]|eukprot:XP_021333332.1 FH1/FH2 domain-containing protein 3-like [Danio rerio]